MSETNGQGATPAQLQARAAQQAQEREEAAQRVQQYIFARVRSPTMARRGPDIADLHALLEERKQFYVHLQNGEMQRIRTIALILHSASLDRVVIAENALTQLEGCSVRQDIDTTTHALIFNLVRPPKLDDIAIADPDADNPREPDAP